MITRFPHRLLLVSSTLYDPVFDSNGNLIVDNTAGLTKVYKCRAEANGAGKSTVTEDGDNVSYGWMVYMPKDTEKIAFNKAVEFFNGTEKIGNGNVKRFHRGQLNVTIWV